MYPMEAQLRFAEPNDSITRLTYRPLKADKILVERGPDGARRLLAEMLALWAVTLLLMLGAISGNGWLQDGCKAALFGLVAAFCMTRLLRAMAYRSGYLDGHRHAMAVYEAYPDPAMARHALLTQHGHVLGLVEKDPHSPQGPGGRA